MVSHKRDCRAPFMSVPTPKSYPLSLFLLLVTLTLSAYLLTFRAAIQSGDTLRAMDAVTSQARFGDWLMDESHWFKPAIIVREESALPLREYDVEERLNIQLAVPLLRLADSLPRLGKIHMVWLFNIIVVSLTVGLIFCLVRTLQFSQTTAAIVAVTAGLGTNLWAYSQTFFRDPLSALFILLAFLAIQLGRERPATGKLISFGIAAAGLVLALMAKFSSAFAIPALLIFLLPGANGRMWDSIRRLVLFLLAVALTCAAVLMVVDPLPLPLRVILDQLGLSAEHAGAALRSYIISPGASIWGTSPIVLLAVPGCWMLWRQRRHWLVMSVVALVLSYSIGHALTTGAHWFGGLSWPPRFLLPVLPILMLTTAPIAEKLQLRGQGILRGLWAALLLYGGWIQFSAVSLSWTEFGRSLPQESHGLAEWLPSMFQPQYFRWVLLPQRWHDLGFDFLWTRAQLPIWGLSFLLLTLASAWALIRLLRHRRSRWRYMAPLLPLICVNLTWLNLSAIYDRDPRAQSAQAALHEVGGYLERQARPGDVLLVPSNDYGNFILNHFGDIGLRPVVLPRPLAQAASDKQPARIVSNNPNSWFDVQTLRVIHHLAGHHDRLWVLSNTSPFMPWSFRPLERYLAQHYYPVGEARLTTPDDTVRLLEYHTSAAAPNPMSLYFGEADTDLQFGDSLRLISYVLPNGMRYQPGDVIPFSLLWLTHAKLNQDYTVATFVVDANRNLPIAQGTDSYPQGGFALTSTWTAGIPVWDNRAIRIPAHAAPGTYRLWAVMYSRDKETGDIIRLPVQGSDVHDSGAIGVLPIVLEIR